MRRVVLPIVLSFVLLLAACGAAPSAPAVSTPAPSSDLPAPTTPADAVPGLASCTFTGDGGEQRAVLEVVGFSSPKPGQLQVEYRVQNQTDLSLTRLRFALQGQTESGAAALEQPIEATQNFLEDPLKAGETRHFTRTHYGTGAERAVSLTLEARQADTERELAPWTEPQPDNALLDFCNDPLLRERFEAQPVELLYQEDQVREVRITDPETIRAALEALRTVRIGNQAERNVDDGGFSFQFTMADGTSFTLRFDYRTLFTWHNLNYEVLDRGKLDELELGES